MSTKYIYSVILLALLMFFGCKPKTELYLERGLDILSNVKKVKFNIYRDVVIEEIGVIRDQKEETKTLVFKLNDNIDKEDFGNNKVIGVTVWIVDKNNNERKEHWDFKPELIEANKHKYILKEIKVKEDRIKKMKIYAYQNIDGKKDKIGSSILLNKIYTYND